MAKFIRLHNAKNNTVVLINTDMISLVDTDELVMPGKKEPKLVSTIYTHSASDVKEFSVNETPEKIYEMLTA